MQSISFLVRLGLLFFPCFLLLSCESTYEAGGVVTDSETGRAISGAMVNYKNVDTAYTDAAGRFRLKKSAIGAAVTGDVELVIEKEGYRPGYFRMARGTAEGADLLVRLNAVANGKSEPRLSQKWVKRMFSINLYGISLLNLCTLLCIWLRPIRWRWFWILLLLTVNPVISTCYVDGVTSFSLFHLPLFLSHYAGHPFTIQWAIPFAMLLFWMLFFRKPEWVRRNIPDGKNNSSEKETTNPSSGRSEFV